MQLGAIFDWDGVVVDSSGQHEESWERLALEVGKALQPGYFMKGFGRKNAYTIRDLLDWTHDDAEIARLSERKEEIFREVQAEKGLVVLPGVRELLTALKEAGIPCIVGSSTFRENIENAIRRAGLEEFFRDIVSAEDVSHGKPDPEVFLIAAQRVGVPPGQCVVFEDAFVGIEAAKAGGMKVVAVATTNPLDSLNAADLAVERLTSVSLDGIQALFTSTQPVVPTC